MFGIQGLAGKDLVLGEACSSIIIIMHDTARSWCPSSILKDSILFQVIA